MFKTLSIFAMFATFAATTSATTSHNPFVSQPAPLTISTDSVDYFSGSLDAGYFRDHHWNLLQGHQSITLAATGQGADFDLYVYDSNTGALIVKDDDDTNVCMVEFWSKFDGAKARIRVVNNGIGWGSYAAELRLND